MKIKSINIVTEKEIIKSGIEIKDGIIQSFLDNDGEDLSDYYLVPGFIDEHIHGAHGNDTMDGDLRGLEDMAISLLKEGTTSFLATTMTMDEEKIKKAINNVYNYHSDRGANVLGIHLEGPFINKTKKGAQNDEYIKTPSIDFIKEIDPHHLIKIVTLAPEESHANEVIKYLKKNNVVSSIGHTNASYKECLEAYKSGASHMTHGYNAMSSFNHREVGAVGAMLLLDDLKVELICDGIHVAKEAVELLYKVKGSNNIILITDAIRAKNLDVSKSELGGKEVFVKNNEARLEDGTLAGSILKMDEALRNIMKFTGASIVEASKMASLNAARSLGIDDKKGKIAVGYDADLVVLDKDYNVYMTIVKGKILYRRDYVN